jgi:hypothetical protein
MAQRHQTRALQLGAQPGYRPALQTRPGFFSVFSQNVYLHRFWLKQTNVTFAIYQLIDFLLNLLDFYNCVLEFVLQLSTGSHL